MKKASTVLFLIGIVMMIISGAPALGHVILGSKDVLSILILSEVFLIGLVFSLVGIFLHIGKE